MNDEELVRDYAKANEVKHPLPAWIFKKLLRETLPKGTYVMTAEYGDYHIGTKKLTKRREKKMYKKTFGKDWKNIYHDGIITKRNCV